MDWKMKFEARTMRETSQAFYGKRGLSWHGVMLEYYRKETVLKGTKEGGVEELDIAQAVKVYIDQILEGENKQEVPSTIAAIDAAVEYLCRSFMWLRSVILLSDNAKCYQSMEATLILNLINGSRWRVHIERFLHTETQDGKSALDAHFGRGSSQVDSFMKHSRPNRIQAIATPKGLAAALAWNGGLTNCAVMLIEVDRLRVEELRNSVKDASNLAKKYIKRTNDVLFLDCHNSDGMTERRS